MRYKTPPALPREVVQEIWAEVNSNGPHATIRELLDAFVPIALGHPHYASGKEIAEALQLETNKVNAAVQRCYSEARKKRILRPVEIPITFRHSETKDT